MTNTTHKLVLNITLLISFIVLNRCSALNSQSSSSRRDIVALSMNVKNLFPDEDLPVQKPKQVLEPPIIETLFEKPSIKPGSLNPKIIVLGSTGKIGRLIIRKLITIPDVTVVAFARDYDTACEVLYDELTAQNTMAKLQLKVLDLVPDQFVFGYKSTDDEDDEEFAVSASRFYQNDIKEYGSRSEKDDEIDLNPYLKLQDAMTNATAVISTVGTVRTTLPFADYVFKPWRIFISPEKWCKDKKHPYYVNYMFHRKLLEYAEEEQRRRNKIWRTWEASKSVDDNNDEESVKKVDKLRIIRISDLCLVAPVWNIVTVMTNICRSLVFKYQEQCEKLLLSSNLVDVIILRPGDLVDDIRNETSTALRVDIDGSLPLPVEVGRDDVATLSCLAALSDLDPNYKTRGRRSPADNHSIKDTRKKRTSRSQRLREQRKNQMTSKKWTIGVGWTNDKHLGYATVETCMEAIVKREDKRTKGERRKHAIRNSSLMFRFLMNPVQSKVKRFKQQSLKPYGVFVLLPMIFCVYPVFASILYSLSMKIPFLKKVTLWALSMSQPLIQYLKDAIIIGSSNTLQHLNFKRTVAKKMLIE